MLSASQGTPFYQTFPVLGLASPLLDLNPRVLDLRILYPCSTVLLKEAFSMGGDLMANDPSNLRILRLLLNLLFPANDRIFVNSVILLVISGAIC